MDTTSAIAAPSPDGRLHECISYTIIACCHFRIGLMLRLLRLSYSRVRLSIQGGHMDLQLVSVLREPLVPIFPSAWHDRLTTGSVCVRLYVC